jgi:hypothetical protein
MKFIIFIVPVVFLLSSCGKTYTCKCDGTVLHLIGEAKFLSKKKAQKWCEGLEDANTPTCVLQ